MAFFTVNYRDFDNNDLTGLSPVFVEFTRLSDNVALTPPAIVELGDGFYRFEYTPKYKIYFKIDAPSLSAQPRLRYVVGSIAPDVEVANTNIDEVLGLLRNNMQFVERDGKTYQQLLRDDSTVWREWEITDQLGRAVSWPAGSRTPVNRDRVI